VAVIKRQVLRRR